ncbi:MAG: hypothetical protein IJK99_09365 [Bacteroidales bacterium]|nr:hypothetical protein [Bacteroidales bacterium]
MERGTVLIYWGPLGAMVYFYLTDDEEGRHVCCKLGTEPETATPGDFWRITPGWMAREQEAGRLELHPEGLGPEEQARIDNYNREKSNF